MKDSAEQQKSTSAKATTLEQVSAGGVVFRLKNSEVEIAIISVAPSGRWQLPKGLIDSGETPEQAAEREVREEAGIETELLEKIKTIEYWYFGEHKNERARFHKLVHFYLMKYKSGDVADHDHEVIEARWIEASEAIKMLAFSAERKIVEAATKMINERPL
jgi:8-oxo-dGTP diphosphatase